MSYLQKILQNRKPKKTVVKSKTGRTRKIVEITPEIIELAVAWAQHDIKLREVQEVLNLKHTTVTYLVMARALRQYVKNLPQ